MPVFSIVVPSWGNIENINQLIKSLHQQAFTKKSELLLCLTSENFNQITNKILPTPLWLDLHIIETPPRGIGYARNLGATYAKGEIIFFLDDDCSLPEPQYLERAYTEVRNQVAVHIGQYKNPQYLNHTSAFYNFLCNLWLASFRSGRNSYMVLGGCVLLPTSLLKQSRAFFSEETFKASEEYTFCNILKSKNIEIFYHQNFDIFHDANCNIRQLLKKAWNHGTAIHSYQEKMHQNRMQTLFLQIIQTPLTTMKFAPLLLVFLSLGRIAYFYRMAGTYFVENKKTFLKRS